MRYLVITQFFHPENFRVNDVVLELKQKGHEVIVLTGQPDYPNPQLYSQYQSKSFWQDEIDGVPIIRVPIISRGNGSKIRLMLNYFSFVFSCILFGLPRLKSPFEACFVWASSPITVCLPAIFYKFLTKTPITMWVQDLWPESISAVGASKSSIFLKLVGHLVRFIYKHTDFLLIQSKGFIPSLKKYGASEEKIIWIPNWAESLNWSEQLSCPEILKDKKNKVLFAGNLGKAQNLEVILKAARLTSKDNINWFLMGDGSEKIWLVNEIKSLKLNNIFYIDRQPSQQMPKYYQHTDLLCVCLKKNPIFSVTIPSKVQTYLAAGKPIVGSIDGISQDLINHSKSGLIAPADDPVTLANNVKALFSLPDKERATMGKNAKQLAEDMFNKSKVLNQIEEIMSKTRKVA